LGKQHTLNDIQELIIDDEHITNQDEIANLLNHYFSTAVDKLHHNTESQKIPNLFFEQRSTKSNSFNGV